MRNSGNGWILQAPRCCCVHCRGHYLWRSSNCASIECYSNWNKGHPWRICSTKLIKVSNLVWRFQAFLQGLQQLVPVICPWERSNKKYYAQATIFFCLGFSFFLLCAVSWMSILMQLFVIFAVSWMIWRKYSGSNEQNKSVLLLLNFPYSHIIVSWLSPTFNYNISHPTWWGLVLNCCNHQFSGLCISPVSVINNCHSS